MDAVVWQPHASVPTTAGPNPPPRWQHVDTFHALGYVQASKRERRFTTCPPGLKYAVISDTSRHVFVYMQPERERRNVAVEYVYSVPSQSANILGLVATDAGIIYVLTTTLLIVLRIPDID